MHSSYKKRKEKKLNMQGKDNMVLGYFIINIHMQLKRRETWSQYFQFLKPTKEFTQRRKRSRKEGRRQLVCLFWRSIIIIHHQIHTRRDKETSTWRLNWFGIEASLYSQITYVRREARGCSFVLSLYLHLVH